MFGRTALLLWMTSIVSPGCAHFARIPVWQPTAATIEDVQTVVVLPFDGEWGTRVSEEVSDAIASSESYAIVDCGSIPSLTKIDPHASPEQLSDVLAAARHADIDAVLTGTIVEESVEPSQSSVFGLIAHRSSSQKTMIVDYRLIDTRSGETLTHDRVVCNQSEVKQLAGRSSEDLLIQLCGAEVVSNLTPQVGNCQTALANCSWMQRGGRLVRQGTRSAEQGDWEKAQDAWEAALNVNPRNDAAIFNLALAAASRGEFADAEVLALEAIRIRHCDCYEQGLGLIRQQMMQIPNPSSSGDDVRLTSVH